MPDSRARFWFALFVLALIGLSGSVGFVLGRHAPPLREWLDRSGADRVNSPAGRGPGRMGGPPFGRGRFGGPAGFPPPVAERLADELNLDATQRERLKAVLDDRRNRFEQIQREARGRFEREQRDLQTAIRELLTPDQAEQFDRFLRERQR